MSGPKKVWQPWAPVATTFLHFSVIASDGIGLAKWRSCKEAEFVDISLEIPEVSF
jgi:hypothetical protein